MDNEPGKKHKIVCVGDSITEGWGATTPNMSYPSILASRISAENIEIVNLGCSGRTMRKQGDLPYWNEEHFLRALASQADTIVLMLGTNDAKSFNWDEEEYEKDYIDMVRQFQKMDGPPSIWLMVPPPLYQEGAFDMKQTVINQLYPEKIPQIAAQCSIPSNQVISIFDALGGPALTQAHCLLDDHCHPNDVGSFNIAQAVADALGLPLHPMECAEDSDDKSQWLHHLGHKEYQYYLKCSGDESGKVLSHAGGNLFLADHVGGAGEGFVLLIDQFPFQATGSQEVGLFFRCMGDESDKCLSHANGQLSL